MACAPRKKRKSGKAESTSQELPDAEEIDEDSKVTFSIFENLPDLVLIKIFSYLNFEDRCNAAYVCHRWYEVSRSSAVWTKVDLKVKNSLHLLKSLLILPSSVTFLSIYCDTFDRHDSLWLPDILTRLHERCPGIKTLIIENIFFSQRFCNTRFTTDHVLLHSFESVKAGSSKQKRSRRKNEPRCKKQCCSERTNFKKYIPKNRPQELSTFSLRYARSYISHLSSHISQFFPKVKILDLTCSAIIKATAVPFFLKLKYLEELYLVECTVTNAALEGLLKNLKNLKVLDLEGSRGIDDDSYMVIQKHGSFLEKLFLGNTSIESFPLAEDSFPRLQTICFRNTLIDDTDISYFIVALPNLKHIDASFCQFMLLQIMTIEAGFYEKDFVYTNEGDPTVLCHHFKKKYT